jgi:hypothetical protein
MATDVNPVTDSEVRRLILVVCSPYSKSEDYHQAMSKLVELNKLTDDLYARAILQRTYRRKAQCNAVVSHRVRQLTREWQGARSRHETESSFEDWIVGKSVGKVQQGWLVVDVDGRFITVMERRHAEQMLFRTIHGQFKLAYDARTCEMLVCTFTCRHKE